MPSRRDAGLLLMLALTYTVINAVKPLQVDDAAYYYFAAQAAREPNNPYGFQVFWYQHPEPANDILAPPLIPYWWSLAIRLFGESPVLWKLWLFPFSALLVWSLHALLSRFARQLAWPMLLATLFSPWLLPAKNLMLDVPALALGLSAVAIFLCGCGRGSLRFVLFAGLIAGMSMQTKYTGALAPAVMLLYGVIHHRVLHAVTAGLAATIVFAGWEAFLIMRYGESHFLHHLLSMSSSHYPKYYLVYPLCTLVGGILPFLGILAGIALKISTRLLVALLAMVLCGFAIVAGVPEECAYHSWDIGFARASYSIGDVVYSLFGAMFWLATASLVWGQCRRRKVASSGNLLRQRSRRTSWFLAGWLLLEIMGYFALSPFPATRRILGIAMVVTLLVGRMAWRAWRSPAHRRLFQAVVAGSALAGLAVESLDIREAMAQREVAHRAAAFARAQGSDVTWYVGHWGFQYYAETAGMRPVDTGVSRLRAGDRLVVPESRIDQQQLELPADKLSLQICLYTTDPVPFRSVPSFYGGRLPLEHHQEARFAVCVFEVTTDFIPQRPIRQTP